MGKSISEIKKEFENSDENSWEKLCGFYEQDSRIGVQNLAAKALFSWLAGYRSKHSSKTTKKEGIL